MARQAYRRFAKDKRRPKSGSRIDPTAANSWFLLSDEEKKQEFVRIAQRVEWAALQAAYREARRAAQAAKRAAMRKG